MRGSIYTFFANTQVWFLIAIHYIPFIHYIHYSLIHSYTQTLKHSNTHTLKHSYTHTLHTLIHSNTQSEYEDVQRNDAQSDIKDFLAKNPAFAKNITDFGIKAGGEILQNNPDLVRQGAHAAMASSSTAPTSDGRGDYANV